MNRKNTNTPKLLDIHFENPRLTTLGIELLTLSELRHKMPAAHLAQPKRMDFFMLILVTDGIGRHTVDFVEWSLKVGSLIFMQPGQVQKWHLEESYEAQLILIDPSALPHQSSLSPQRELGLLDFAEWRSAVLLDSENRQGIEAIFKRLRGDFEQFFGAEIDVALIRHELMALLLRLAKLQHKLQLDAVHTSSHRKTYRLFIQLLDANFSQQHSLQYYAQRLGYSQSTISRACITKEGRSAKCVINRRIILEAQRLLVHSTVSVAEIAYQLGFSEATNFVKFFRRHIDMTPMAFRKQALCPSI